MQEFHPSSPDRDKPTPITLGGFALCLAVGIGVGYGAKVVGDTVGYSLPQIWLEGIALGVAGLLMSHGDYAGEPDHYQETDQESRDSGDE